MRLLSTGELELVSGGYIWDSQYDDTSEIEEIIVTAMNTDSISWGDYQIIAEAYNNQNIELDQAYEVPDLSGIEWGTFYAEGFELHDATAQDIEHFKQAIDYLKQSPTGAAVIAQALADGIQINIIHDGDDRANGTSVFWDPESGNRLSDGGLQSAALGLVHEIYHTYQSLNIIPSILHSKYPGNYDNIAEFWTINGIERTIAIDLGEPTRDDHLGTAEGGHLPTDHT